MRIRIFLATLASLALAPRLALACPTCFAASSPGALLGYWWSTTLLSFMPFVLIGAVALIGWAAHSRRTSTPDRDVINPSP